MLRFVHAADLHLDSPMRGLSARTPHLLPLFADATRRAFETLVDQTLAAGASLLIVAGDVYDGDWRDHGTGLFFARQLARLTRAGVRVALIRGNHDAESVISRSLTLPDGVYQFGSRRAETWDLPELGLALHGRSFAERAVTENIALAYPAARPGRLNVGILHTSCDGHQDHATYAPCSQAELATLGYEYWALGHIHVQTVLRTEPWIVFPGNIQGRHVREAGPRGAMLVEAEGPRILRTEPLVADVARWARAEVDLTGAADPGEAIAAIEAALRQAATGQGERALAVRLVLGGRTRVHRAFAADRAGLEAEIQAAADRIADRIGLESVELRTQAPHGAAPERKSFDSMRFAESPSLDPLSLLDGLDESALGARLDGAAADILQKLPDEVRQLVAPGWDGGALPDAVAADLAALGRELALGRLSAAD